MKTPVALDALKALAQESRLALFRLLVQAGPAGMAVGDLAERTGLPGATLTSHLHRLRRAGLVRDERFGRSILCRADYTRMNALIAYLTENCCVVSGDKSCVEGAVCTPANPKKAKP
jgi:DNA-binding transcriptional ArsR family regulator